MFYLHFLIGLTSSRTYWRVAKNLVTVLKLVIKVNFLFVKSLRKSKRKKKD